MLDFEEIWGVANKLFDRHRSRHVNEPWKIVPRGAVPKTPPIRPVAGKYSQIVTALKGLKEDEVVEVTTNGMKHLGMFRKQIQKVAKTKTNRRVLSSRDADGKTLWLWLEPTPVVDAKTAPASRIAPEPSGHFRGPVRGIGYLPSS